MSSFFKTVPNYYEPTFQQEDLDRALSYFLMSKDEKNQFMSKVADRLNTAQDIVVELKKIDFFAQEFQSIRHKVHLALRYQKNVLEPIDGVKRPYTIRSYLDKFLLASRNGSIYTNTDLELVTNKITPYITQLDEAEKLSISYAQTLEKLRRGEFYDFYSQGKDVIDCAFEKAIAKIKEEAQAEYKKNSKNLEARAIKGLCDDILIKIKEGRISEVSDQEKIDPKGYQALLNAKKDSYGQKKLELLNEILTNHKKNSAFMGIDVNKKIFHRLYLNEIKFDEHLESFQQEAKAFEEEAKKNPQCKQESIAANLFCTRLIELKEDFLKSKIDENLEETKKSLKLEIEKAAKEAENTIDNSSFKHKIMNFIDAVFGDGIVKNLASKLGFFPYQAAYGKEIKTLIQDLNPRDDKSHNHSI